MGARSAPPARAESAVGATATCWGPARLFPRLPALPAPRSHSSPRGRPPPPPAPPRALKRSGCVNGAFVGARRPPVGAARRRAEPASCRSGSHSALWGAGGARGRVPAPSSSRDGSRARAGTGPLCVCVGGVTGEPHPNAGPKSPPSVRGSTPFPEQRSDSCEPWRSGRARAPRRAPGLSAATTCCPVRAGGWGRGGAPRCAVPHVRHGLLRGLPGVRLQSAEL